MFGKPKPSIPLLAEGTYYVRLCALLAFGAIPGQYGPNQKLLFKFETLDAGEVFDESKGKQPFLIRTTLYGTKKPIEFFKMLVERSLTENEQKNGFNPMDVVGHVFRVRVEHVEKGEKVYLNIAAVKDMLSENEKTEVLQNASSMTLNPLHVYSPAYMVDLLDDPSEWRSPKSAAQLVESSAFQRLNAYEKQDAVEAVEFKKLEGAADYPKSKFETASN